MIKRMQVEQRLLFVADCLSLTSGPQVGFLTANQQKKKSCKMLGLIRVQGLADDGLVFVMETKIEGNLENYWEHSENMVGTP